MNQKYGVDTLVKIHARCTKNENGCLVWEGATSSNGYAHITIKGKTINCHRLVKEITSGTSGAVAMHSCDNRSCLNPDHIEWGTQKRNLQDMSLRNRSALAKITSSEASEIRNLYSTGLLTQKDLAKKFKTSQTNVSQIVTRKTWQLSK